jgi:integrase
VTVARSRARVKGEWVVKAPKTAKSRRTVPLTATAVAALRAHRAAQQVTSLDGLVFTTSRGLPVHSGRDWADFQALLAHAGLPRWRVHDLRHACATLLREQGADARVVQEILGHSSAAFTDQAYVHVSAGLQAKAVEALDKALGG